MFLTLTHSNFISILLVPSSCACTTAIFSQFCVRSRGQFLCCFFTPFCSFSFSVALHCCSCLSQYLLRSSPFSLLWFNGFAVCSFLTIRCYFRSFTSFSRFALFVFNFLYYSLLLFLLGFSYSFFFFFGNCCHCCASIAKLVPFPGCLRPSPRTLRGNCKLRCIVQAS